MEYTAQLRPYLPIGGPPLEVPFPTDYWQFKAIQVAVREDLRYEMQCGSRKSNNYSICSMLHLPAL